MAEEKKSPEKRKGKRKPEKPLDGGIKVTLEMKEMLEEVAEDLGFYPGELIEHRMGAWLRGESFRVRKLKFEQAKKAAGN